MQFNWDQNTDPIECNLLVAMVTQFSLMASLLWYLCLSLNAYYSISNPFRHPNAKTTTYHIAVWSGSALSALLAVPQNSAFRQDYRICWFKKREGLNLYNWIGFFIWVMAFMAVGVMVLVWAWRKLKVSCV